MIQKLLYNLVIFVIIFIISLIITVMLNVIFNIQNLIGLILPIYILVCLLSFKRFKKLSNNLFDRNHIDNYLSKKQNDLVKQFNYEDEIVNIQHQAFRAMQEGDFKESIDIYTSGIQYAERENDASIMSMFYQNRGTSFKAIEDYKNAILDWKSAIKCNPSRKEELETKINEIKDLMNEVDLLDSHASNGNPHIDFTLNPFIYILDYILSNNKEMTYKKDFEKIQNTELILLDEDESCLANNLKQNLLAVFGSYPEHKENYYEVKGAKNPIIITVAFYRLRLVNFNIQILSKRREDANKLFSELENYFKISRSYIKFRASNIGYTGSSGIYNIRYYLEVAENGASISVSVMDKEFS